VGGEKRLEHRWRNFSEGRPRLRHLRVRLSLYSLENSSLRKKQKPLHGELDLLFDLIIGSIYTLKRCNAAA